MTFPFKNSYTIGYRFFVKTYYSPHHLGVDYHFNSNVPVFAHLDGWISKIGWDSQIGNYLVMKDSNGKYIRHCHLKRIDVGIGAVSEGQQLGLVGNTGQMGSVKYSIHDHLDCWNAYPNVSLVKQTWDKNLLIDPEIYFKSNEEEKMQQWTETIKFMGNAQYGHLNPENVLNPTITQMVSPDSKGRLIIKFKDSPDAYIHLANQQAGGIMTGTNQADWTKLITELDLVPKSELEGANEQIKKLSAQIKNVADYLGVLYDEDSIIEAIKELKKSPKPNEPMPPTPSIIIGWLKTLLTYISNFFKKIFHIK